MDSVLKEWLGLDYDRLSEYQRELVALKALNLQERFVKDETVDARDNALRAYVQWLLSSDPKPKAHRYVISFAITVNRQLGTGSTTICLDHVLNEDDVKQVLVRQRDNARANFDPEATMPNVTSIWKFED